MQWLTLRRVTNYVEKHRLLSTDYKSPSNGRSREKKKVEAKQDIRRGQEFFSYIDRSTSCQLLIPQLPQPTTAQLLKSTVKAWIIIVVKALLKVIF